MSNAAAAGIIGTLGIVVTVPALFAYGIAMVAKGATYNFARTLARTAAQSLFRGQRLLRIFLHGLGRVPLWLNSGRCEKISYEMFYNLGRLYAKIDRSFYFFKRVCNSHEIEGCKAENYKFFNYVKDSFLAYGIKTWKLHRTEIEQSMQHLSIVISYMTEIENLMSETNKNQNTREGAKGLALILVETNGEQLKTLVKNLKENNNKAELVNNKKLSKGFAITVDERGNPEIGEQIILPYINEKNIEELDRLITDFTDFFKNTTVDLKKVDEISTDTPSDSPSNAEIKIFLNRPVIQKFEQNVELDDSNFQEMLQQDHQSTESTSTHDSSTQPIEVATTNRESHQESRQHQPHQESRSYQPDQESRSHQSHLESRQHQSHQAHQQHQSHQEYQQQQPHQAHQQHQSHQAHQQQQQQQQYQHHQQQHQQQQQQQHQQQQQQQQQLQESYQKLQLQLQLQLRRQRQLQRQQQQQQQQQYQQQRQQQQPKSHLNQFSPTDPNPLNITLKRAHHKRAGLNQVGGKGSRSKSNKRKLTQRRLTNRKYKKNRKTKRSRR